MNKSDNYILFIGMGDWDVPKIQIARNKGYKVIVTNRDKNALALKKADIPIIADGRNVFSILSFIYQNHLEKNIKYVNTGTELFTTVALLSQSLNIPWNSPLSAYICENKKLMREKFKENNIPIPKGFSVKLEAEALSKIKITENIKYIMKPADSLSAKGVIILNRVEDVKSGFNYSVQYSSSKTVICEEYIVGSLHDVNGILTNKKLIKLGINDKKAGPLPYAVVVEGCGPTVLPIKLQEEVYLLFEKACRAVGLSNGPVKGDLIMDTKNNIYIMEVAPRLHGPLGSLYVIPLALGINPFEELLNYQDGFTAKEHDIYKKYQKNIFSTASDKKAKVIEKGKILKILDKPGIYNKKLWKSNYDVPYYIIWESNL